MDPDLGEWMYPDSPRGHPPRPAPAIEAVRRALAEAEERYLIDPGATLGTWYARVGETLAVASRVALERIEGGHSLAQEEAAAEQAGLYADVCAEAIRAAAQVWGSRPATRAREEALERIASAEVAQSPPSWEEMLRTLARCTAALEPLANGLREGDLPMGEPTECERVAQCFFEVADQAFSAVHSLCI